MFKFFNIPAVKLRILPPFTLEIFIKITATKKRCIVYVGNDSNLLIVLYVQIMPDDFVMQLHRF